MQAGGRAGRPALVIGHDSYAISWQHREPALSRRSHHLPTNRQLALETWCPPILYNNPRLPCLPECVLVPQSHGSWPSGGKRLLLSRTVEIVRRRGQGCVPAGRGEVERQTVMECHRTRPSGVSTEHQGPDRDTRCQITRSAEAELVDSANCTPLFPSFSPSCVFQYAY